MDAARNLSGEPLSNKGNSSVVKEDVFLLMTTDMKLSGIQFLPITIILKHIHLIKIITNSKPTSTA